jgi:hypothetical protein
MASEISLEVDTLTVKTVNTKPPAGGFYPANYTLVTDGRGGTVWSTINTAGIPLSFDRIFVDGREYIASNTLNRFSLNTGFGLTSITNDPTSATLISKSFQTVQVVGGNAIQAFTTLPYPTLNIQGLDGIQVVGDPDSHTLSIRVAAATLSTGVYGWYRNAIYSNCPTVSTGLFSNPAQATVLDASSASSIFSFVGLKDIILTTDYANRAVYIGISSFTSENYSTLQDTAFNAFSRTLSSVSTQFVAAPFFSTTTSITTQSIQSLSTTVASNFQAVNTSLLGYATVEQFQYVQDFVQNSYLKISTLTLPPPTAIPMNATAGQTFEFSTANFSLSFLSSPELQDIDIQLVYSPSFLFSSVTSPSLYFISTVIMAGNSLIEESVFVRPWYAMNTTMSNLYTDTIGIDIHQSNITNSPGSTLSFYHRIVGFSAGTQSSMTNLTPSRNSLTLHAHHEIIPFSQQ